MRLNRLLLTFGFLFCLVQSLAADELNWSGIQVSFDDQTTCTVQITVDVYLDSVESAKLALILQDPDYKPIPNQPQVSKPIQKGYNKISLEKTVTIPAYLSQIQIWSPLFTTESETSKLITKTINFREFGGQRVATVVSE